MFITVFADVRAAMVYQNNFDSGSSSLSGFTSYGTATNAVSAEQLVIGISGLSGGGISLNTATLNGYSTTLSANVGMVTWAFNVSNSNGAYNNMFCVVLAGNTSDPYNSGFPAKGYSLKGGGYVGNRMLLSRFDRGLNTYQILIDVPNTLGLGTLPQTGAVRITYEPRNDIWSLYMDTGLIPGDPSGASLLLGAAVDGTYTHSALPFFALGGEISGTDYFDNLSINVVPEPSSLCLAVAGLTILCWPGRRSRH